MSDPADANPLSVTDQTELGDVFGPHLTSAETIALADTPGIAARSSETSTNAASEAESDAEAEAATDKDPNTRRSAIEWIAVIVSALVIALLIKAYIVQAFEIPSGSMQTTLNIDDRILVNKLSYTFGDVERGDLTVFSKLEGTQSSTDELIKRVIALPGETVELRNDGQLWIWGPGETEADAVRLDEPYLDAFNERLAAPHSSDPISLALWDPRCVNVQGNGGRCTLDNSSYFMMGDNRNASTDSRSFGPVPEENVVGRAFLRIWPLNALGGL